VRAGTSNSGLAAQKGFFETTHWSVIRRAAVEGSPLAAAALNDLCRAYWYPLYAYARRGGKSPENAQDLTQAFFAHLLHKDFLTGLSPEKGKFRSFLLTCFKHFMADDWEKARTAKRSAVAAELPVDNAEARYLCEPCVEANPETLYERRWALDLLENVLQQLRAQAAAAGREKIFESLQSRLLGEHGEETYAQLAQKLNLSDTALKVAVHRLRQNYRELLRGEIARTVAHPDEIEDEVRYLFTVVSRG
jgi:RNA polymerase sigma factor (sigma-70 family)